MLHIQSRCDPCHPGEKYGGTWRSGNAVAEIVPRCRQLRHLPNRSFIFSSCSERGRTLPEIAEELGISIQTRRNHLHHIDPKLRTHNRLEPVLHAIQRKLV